ncbi:MAG TPA: undecaprenyl-phosphate glucose phosphotransferase [Burkholderiales bacterium]|jgi:putative colanic acid biosynthesis UDP-glucose lipid carrier transferase
MLLGATGQQELVRSQWSLVRLVRSTIEPVLIIAALLGSTLAFDGEFEGKDLILCLLVFSLTYPGRLSRGRIARPGIFEVFGNWLIIAFMLAFFGYATRSLKYFDLRVLLTWAAVVPFLLFAAYRMIPLILPRLLAVEGYRSAVIVGANEIGRKLAREFSQEAQLGVRFVGFFDDRSAHRLELVSGETLHGGLEGLPEYVKREHVEAIFIALPMSSQPRLQKILDELRDTTASIYFAPDIFIYDLIQARIDHINGIPVVAVCETPFYGVNGMVKRASDVVLASLILILLIPALIAIAIAVKATSPGPVLFRQRRYGLDGREIVVYKFRSMTVTEDGNTVVQAQRNDKRVTPLGAVLRRTSLDELPQFINVLQGRMSIVGPRPHAVAHNESYRKVIKGYMMRHKVKPGITGWAQVNGLRGETESVDKMKARIDYDLDYLRNWSLRFDLMIILRTVFVVLGKQNAY